MNLSLVALFAPGQLRAEVLQLLAGEGRVPCPVSLDTGQVALGLRYQAAQVRGRHVAMPLGRVAEGHPYAPRVAKRSTKRAV